MGPKRDQGRVTTGWVAKGGTGLPSGGSRTGRRGLWLLVALTLAPTVVWAAETRPTLREYVEMSERAQEVYAAAYMWGAATALAKAGTPAGALDTCASAGRDPAEIAAMVRASAIVAPPQDGERSVNHALGAILFEGCRFQP
ncbi:MAG TPA: hypothetical protein VJX92_08280 [Methylomirabilota bacterium]|nr:hypothetical protein [Methylomirabilota bacterium]